MNEFTFREGTISIPHLTLQDGSVLSDTVLRYQTLGKPRRNDFGRINNAVLLLHSTGGSSDLYKKPSLGQELFRRGGALDWSHYYIILPDSLGHGGSTKPSDGLRTRFPRYGYKDMVRAQHLLVTSLGVNELNLVAGMSMGGMHTWLWGVMFPEFADRLFALTSTPAPIRGRNLLWRHLIIEAITNDPGWHSGDYTRKPSHWLNVMPITRLLLESSSNLLHDIPDRTHVKSTFDAAVLAYSDRDPTDLLYAFQASFDYEPELELEKITAKLVSVNFGDDFTLAPELAMMENAIRRVKSGRSILIEDAVGGAGHMSQFDAALWSLHLSELLSE